MKLRKHLAAILAAALSLSMMATSASAGITIAAPEKTEIEFTSGSPGSPESTGKMCIRDSLLSYGKGERDVTPCGRFFCLFMIIGKAGLKWISSVTIIRKERYSGIGPIERHQGMD